MSDPRFTYPVQLVWLAGDEIATIALLGSYWWAYTGHTKH